MALRWSGYIGATNDSSANPQTYTENIVNASTGGAGVPGSTNLVKVAVLFIMTGTGTSRAGGAPTFGGSAFTQAGSTQKAAVSPEVSAELWYKLDPATGNNTVSIPNTGVIDILSRVGYIYADNATAGRVKFDVAAGSNNTSTNPTTGAATVKNYGGIGIGLVASGADTWAPSGRTGTQIWDTDVSTFGWGAQWLQNNGPVSNTLSWTFGTSDDWGACAGWFYEDPAPISEHDYLFVRADSGISVSERIR